jgi:hypothetical protein
MIIIHLQVVGRLSFLASDLSACTAFVCTFTMYYPQQIIISFVYCQYIYRMTEASSKDSPPD